MVATLDGAVAYKDAEFVIIAAPINYDFKKDFFDCFAVEAVIKLVLSSNANEMMVNNNRRDGFAGSNYGSRDSWNDYISLVKTSLVDLMSPTLLQGLGVIFVWFTAIQCICVRLSWFTVLLV